MPTRLFLTLAFLIAAVLACPCPAIAKNDPAKSGHTKPSHPMTTPQVLETLVVESYDKDLAVQVFTLRGERVPCTLYKIRSGGLTIYETGHDLEQGIYLVRIVGKDREEYFKLIRKSN